MVLNSILKEHIREIRQDLRSFFENHLLGYNKFYQIALIRYTDIVKKTTKKYTIPSAFSDTRGFDMVLYKENIVYKNQDANRRENVYIHFHPKTKYSKLIWLDDIKLKTAQNSLLWDYLTLIETHSGNFQAFIKLDRWLDIPTLQLLKSYLVRELKADIAAQSYIQPMRLPFLWNWKYNPPYLITLYKESFKKLETQDLLEQIKSDNKTLAKGDKALYTLLESKELKDTLEREDWVSLREFIRQTLLTGKYKSDESTVDFYFAKYLYGQRYKVKDIFKLLQIARESIVDKKEGHLQDYIERTVLKAIISTIDKEIYKSLSLNASQKGKRVIDYAREICRNWDVI